MEAVFQATYADLKLVKTRGVLQIIFEAPVEKDNEIMTVLGGMPRAAEERWFAIARLNIGGAATQNPTHSTIGQNHTSERAARNALPQRAALLCNDPQFRLFLEGRYKHLIPQGSHINNANEAADVVRFLCEVESRAEIKLGTPAADKFDHLEGQFRVWKHADRYVEAPRIQQTNQA